MGWFSRNKRKAQVARETRTVPDALTQHLVDFVSSRRGVEAWIEQPTNFNRPSILLIAADGESTRRGIPSADFGYAFAAHHQIPCYDAGVVPYPQRMRDYGKKQRAQRRNLS